MINVSKPLTSMVYNQLYTMIINGELTSNDILTESSLVAQFNVSKSPVREALIMLCEEGMLRSVPRVGYQVLQLLPGETKEMIDARLALELYMLRQSWDSIDPEEIEKLEKHLARIKQDELVNTSVLANWERNSAFHMLLASFAKNDYMLSMLDRTLRSCARAAAQYFFNVRNIPHGDHDLHDDLMEALRAKDLDAMLKTLECDIRQTI